MTVGQPRAVVASSVAALGLASSLACGEIKKADDDSTMADAAEQGGEPDAMGAIDAAPARCSPDSPFAAPVALDAVSSSEELNDEAAALSADELTLYFSSDRAGDYDLYVATRDQPDAGFSTPEPVPGLSEPSRLERRPAISADGLQLFSQISSGTDLEIRVATRTNTGEPFAEPVSAPGLNSDTASDYTPYAVGGNSLYFASTRETGETTSDIWRATWNGTAFDAPAKVAGADLVTASEESNPVLTPDELTLFFDSNRVRRARHLRGHTPVDRRRLRPGRPPPRSQQRRPRRPELDIGRRMRPLPDPARRPLGHLQALRRDTITLISPTCPTSADHEAPIG